DRSNIYVIKYFCNAGWFRERFTSHCPHCPDIKCSRKHAVEDCPTFNQERTKLESIIGSGDLEEKIDHIYFRNDYRDINWKSYNAMKEFIVSIMTEHRDEEKYEKIRVDNQRDFV